VRKLLIANRGEIAVRVIRSARELGIQTVAVYSEVDEDALHVRLADERVLIGGPIAARSYLDADAVIGAALELGAEAIHPGYGFLSERAEFAEKVAQAKLRFVGPSAESIRLMGDKAAAREVAEDAGVPTVPGSNGPVNGLEEALAAAEAVGYPAMVKAAAGGGGRGIRIVNDAAELREVLPVAQAESAAAFGSSEVYVERYLARARHIEVQVFGDGTNFIHLGIRDCSLQRRRQKVVEEAGDVGLSQQLQDQITASAVALARECQYSGAGTVEFLYDEDRDTFYFIEMNTRIQVEHPVTEMITGRDLVRQQLLIAAGEPLTWRQSDITMQGHAIEARINAENPDFNFMPSPGKLTAMHMPGGPFVRVDTGYAPGDSVSPYYDSLVAKVIVWDADRPSAVARMSRALGEVDIEGITTTTAFLQDVVARPDFHRGDFHTTSLEAWMAATHQGGHL
jgi:acetyl-CoA carboxylase biotin carboxylase subunit